ncbi:UDP-N-acetylglucosamine 2-epimerase [Orenia metallireducens]|uniref:UDP-N-acetylglucosamine 2-epimerase (non-hydrolyzing) n=1 Tax=Orenia metallireducens TaxID=1413210 RepID=A0A285FYK9_9FIRM|nr:UDP-N-acetylglucosamine 2-epimerase (non-hydrolyzing) [Orenia metallireducens]PRX35665.1 UDP-N-acetylglucosamine 2-epimerase [Orenia metallireducens]SNY15406.1 UDP-N-Acetylglucosamine 2-epimerase [Orenia metallireducens]
MNKLKVMSIFGTRPEAIKMAPVIKELEKREEIESVVTVTAQHREMLDQVLTLFNIRADYDLDIMKAGQSLSEITARILKGLEEIIIKEKPDLVLVHGDTTTSFVAALASFYQQVSIAHIEAGLRSYDRYSPYPEEVNRHLIGGLANFHFAPTYGAKENLLRENISEENIYISGNTVIDSLLSVVDEGYSFDNKQLNQIDFNNKKVILLTTHRRENLTGGLRNIFNAVYDLTLANPELEFIFPMHLNPRVREVANDILGGLERVHLIEPLSYKEFANLMAKVYLIMTDSGGIQEEAPSLGKPVLVLRDTTERPEAIAAGTVKLIGTEKDTINYVVNSLINNEEKYSQMASAINPYGDGLASRRIMEMILYYFGYSNEKIEEFIGEEERILEMNL